ncbi:MAG: FliA/WhiG family RNA polymerase sigma factor [Phycisphaerales bacterium JB054]
MTVARSSMARAGTRGASRRSARHAEPSNLPSPYDDLPIQEVWETYQKAGDAAIRNYLMEKYLPLVRYNAERIYARLPDEVDLEDLMSAGLFGLMDAIDAFDLGYKVKFETYCAPRIRGAILDELRSMDWVPRLVRQRSGKVEQARQRFEMETGQPANHEDIADRLALEKDELEKYMRDGRAVGTVSLNRKCYPGDSSRDVREIDIIQDEAQSNPLADIQRNDLKELITKGLSRAEKLIVLLYYYEGMTMKEIGSTLDLSESRVSQMHSSILARLKAQMQHRMKELESAGE